MGFGFVLISSCVLRMISFRSNKLAADTFFYQDLARLGIPAYVCPAFVKNLKIEENSQRLQMWNGAREILLQKGNRNHDRNC
jgi:hypothetical protein